MDRRTENKIVLVVRPTRLDDLVARFNTESQAKFYIEHLGADFSDYKTEHVRYRQAVRSAERALSRLGRLQRLDRAYVPNFVFGREDVVVVLGQDGLVANVLKYLDGQPVLGVNPDPDRWEGVLLPFRVGDLPRAIPEVFEGRRPVREVTMAEARLSTGERLHAVNDLFIGMRTHVSARYVIETRGRKEAQSSSGVIVSTGLGSTGWLRSVLAGATGIAGALMGKKLEVEEKRRFEWDADYLTFSVREPFPSKRSSAGIAFGKVTSRSPLRIVSEMPEDGVIFSDGVEKDFLQFHSGVSATISVAEKRGRLVG